MCVLLVQLAHETAGAARTRHSPRPLFWGEGFQQRPDALRRGIAEVRQNMRLASFTTLILYPAPAATRHPAYGGFKSPGFRARMAAERPRFLNPSAL